MFYMVDVLYYTKTIITLDLKAKFIKNSKELNYIYKLINK